MGTLDLENGFGDDGKLEGRLWEWRGKTQQSLDVLSRLERDYIEEAATGREAPRQPRFVRALIRREAGSRYNRAAPTFSINESRHCPR